MWKFIKSVFRFIGYAWAYGVIAYGVYRLIIGDL